jgi:integrase/recombinase XerD
MNFNNLYFLKEQLITRKMTEIERNRENRVFPMISNQKTNKALKEIALLCNFNKKLTFHSARHTFATTITLTNGVPIVINL